MKARKRERDDSPPQERRSDSSPRERRSDSSPRERRSDSSKSGNNNNRSRSNSRGKGRSRNKRGNRRRKQRNRQDGARFWGDASKLPELRTDVRMTDRPATVPRSLGPAPLPGHEAVAEHYFDAVYERAVTTAGAIAAAGGLIDPETLTGGNPE